MKEVVLRKNINALPSGGGPKTVEGKARSSQNSLRHGLTAKQTVIPGEDQAEFDELHRNLMADRKPSGEPESQLVAEIAACMRLARARRHEARILELTHDLYAGNAPKLELVIRYVASIERELHRTIIRLERLQSERGKVDAQSPQLKRETPAPLKAMCAGSSSAATFTSATEQFVSQTDRTPAPAAPVVRFAS